MNSKLIANWSTNLIITQNFAGLPCPFVLAMIEANTKTMLANLGSGKNFEGPCFAGYIHPCNSQGSDDNWLFFKATVVDDFKGLAKLLIFKAKKDFFKTK